MKQASNGTNPLNSLKLKNRREVLELLRHASPISIADLAAKTALSKVTVTKILDFYRTAGLVVTAGKAASDERGKPANFFALNPDHKFMFCVKIDGYNMLATLTNLGGRIFASHTTLYDQGIELEQLIRCIGEAFDMLVQRERLSPDDCLATVAGLHGVIDPETGVCFLSPQFPRWGQNIPMRDLLAGRLPAMSIHVDNWVHHYGRGEVTVMEKPVDRFLLISSEIEGINGALMLDGKLYRGHDCLSGEIGHMIVDAAHGAEVCQCGGRGCFEAVVSPRRMLARIRKRLAEYPDSGLLANRVAPVAFKDVADAADAGDALAREEMQRSARFFAIGIRNVMQTFDPELVLIQGEYAGAGEYFLDEVRAGVPRTSLLGLKKAPQIEYSRLGQYGAIIGAANYAADIFFANA